MTAAESSELKLPSWQTAASMLEGTTLSPVPTACPSSPFPVPSGPRAALAQPVASYGARERPADHRATLGELVVFVAKNDPRLEALDATFAARRKEVFNAGHFEVFEASLKQRTRAFLKLPEKARSHKMIFMAETKFDLLAVNSSADVSAVALGKLWEAEEKEAAEGTTKYAKQALREATPAPPRARALAAGLPPAAATDQALAPRGPGRGAQGGHQAAPQSGRPRSAGSSCSSGCAGGCR